MPRFLITYHGSNMPHDAESMAKARDAFMHWAGKTGPALVDPGAPVGAARTISSDGTNDGLADGPFNGWSVIEADDLDARTDISSPEAWPEIHSGSNLGPHSLEPEEDIDA